MGMTESDTPRSTDGLVYHDDAHRDAWSGLSHLGVWDFKVTAEMVGKSFGEAIDALLQREDVPVVKLTGEHNNGNAVGARAVEFLKQNAARLGVTVECDGKTVQIRRVQKQE